MVLQCPFLPHNYHFKFMGLPYKNVNDFVVRLFVVYKDLKALRFMFCYNVNIRLPFMIIRFLYNIISFSNPNVMLIYFMSLNIPIFVGSGMDCLFIKLNTRVCVIRLYLFHLLIICVDFLFITGIMDSLFECFAFYVYYSI